jgi:outer membrane protein assembly factor BamA
MRSRWSVALFSSLILLAAGEALPARRAIGRVAWTGGASAVEKLEEGSLLGRGTVLTDSLLSLELSRIDSLCFSMGLLSAGISVDTADAGGEIGITMRIEEGERARIGTVSVYGQSSSGADEILGRLGVRRGEYFSPARTGAAMASLLNFLNEGGYPFAQVWLTGFEYDAGRVEADLSFTVYEGDRSTVSEVIFEGISRTDSAMAERISRLKKGALFTERDLEKAAGYLRSSRIFASVSEPRVAGKGAGSVAVVIPIEEKKNCNSFQGAFGFSRRDDGEYSVNGSVRLALENLAGKGRNIRFDWLNDGRKYSRSELVARVPFLLGMPLHVDLEIRQTVQDTLYDLVSGGGYLRFPAGPAWTIVTGAAADRTVFGGGAEIARTSRQRYRAGVERDAGSGSSVSLYLEGALKKDYPEQGPAESGGQMLYRLEGDMEIPVAGRQSIFGRVVSEGIFSDGKIPLSEMFQLGGARSLRGYRENQFRAEKVEYVNLEYRIGRESRIFFFDDIGVFFRETDGWILKNGFGFGLRSVSQVGTVELSFGVGDEFSLNETKIHISLIETF